MVLGLWMGKMAGWASRVRGHSGSSLPGKVALSVNKTLLQQLAKQVENIIIVTGTNGKTTTSHLIYEMLKVKYPNVMANTEGSNLITGVTSAFMKESNLLGRLKKMNAAIIEVDEGNLPLVLAQVQPKAVVVTNFFRDQLDRYAEIDQLVEKIKTALTSANTALYLNADDPFTFRLAESCEDVSYFGIEKGAYQFDDQTLSESKYCTCGRVLKYEAVHYGQLGFYECECGFKRPEVYTKVQLIEADGALKVQVNGTSYTSHLKGAYNAYNIAGAICCVMDFGLSDDNIQDGLSNYRPTNGRMQSFDINNQLAMLNLAKNAQGVNSTLEEYLKNHDPKQIILGLNDLYADGQDVSWIWDVHYERLVRNDIQHVICTGVRAYDMALRLMYAGIDPSIIEVSSNLKDAVVKASETALPSYFICNYTTLAPTRDALSQLENVR